MNTGITIEERRAMRRQNARPKRYRVVEMPMDHPRDGEMPYTIHKRTNDREEACNKARYLSKRDEICIYVLKMDDEEKNIIGEREYIFGRKGLMIRVIFRVDAHNPIHYVSNIGFL